MRDLFKYALLFGAGIAVGYYVLPQPVTAAPAAAGYPRLSVAGVTVDLENKLGTGKYYGVGYVPTGGVIVVD